jgi:DNA-directed RNA polymerase specialized sigma24 family protein
MERQTLCIPVSIFKDERLTPFELIVKYLKEMKNLTYAEIGRQLNRDERNIWTVYQRAKKKVE